MQTGARSSAARGAWTRPGLAWLQGEPRRLMCMLTLVLMQPMPLMLALLMYNRQLWLLSPNLN